MSPGRAGPGRAHSCPPAACRVPLRAGPLRDRAPHCRPRGFALPGAALLHGGPRGTGASGGAATPPAAGGGNGLCPLRCTSPRPPQSRVGPPSFALWDSDVVPLHRGSCARPAQPWHSAPWCRCGAGSGWLHPPPSSALCPPPRVGLISHPMAVGKVTPSSVPCPFRPIARHQRSTSWCVNIQPGGGGSAVPL